MLIYTNFIMQWTTQHKLMLFHQVIRTCVHVSSTLICYTCCTIDPSLYIAGIRIIDDDILEGEESFTLSISFPTGFENVSATVFIEDNEGKFDGGGRGRGE